jgi:hypothetical protein
MHEGYFCLSLHLLPNFHCERFPYVIVRDKKRLAIFDIKKGQSYLLLDIPYHVDTGN